MTDDSVPSDADLARLATTYLRAYEVAEDAERALKDALDSRDEAGVIIEDAAIEHVPFGLRVSRYLKV